MTAFLVTGYPLGVVHVFDDILEALPAAKRLGSVASVYRDDPIVPELLAVIVDSPPFFSYSTMPAGSPVETS